jgi:TonB family protein
MTEHTTQLEHIPTTDAWKQWEGQVVNGVFPLHRYLGGSPHSAVFLTSYGERDAQTAAIKLALDDPATAEQRLNSWELATGLSHPGLLRLFQGGRCELDGVRLLYVVMEYAEEDLSQILPQRALTPSEAREMLRPAVDALAYLHGMAVVHGHIRPANILACADQVKLSSDGLCRAGEPASGPDNLDSLDRYSPPERKHSPAQDAWAVGMTLVEVLTQRLPEWERASAEAEPVVPETLAEPFLQIARRCLRRNPSLRLKASDIASRLEPLPSPELPEIAEPIETCTRISHLAWIVAIGLLLAAIMASSIWLKHDHHTQKMRPTAIEKPQPQKHAEQAAIKKLLSPTPSVQPSPAKPELHASIRPAEEKKIPIVSSVQDEAIHQVLPDVPRKAQDTIQGTVRVSVRVSVDPSGRVADAAIDSAGPSRYFANLALQAAQKWTFGPAKGTRPDNLREWILHFEFSSTDTQARPVPAIP